MRERCDVLVVGGGPVGSATALALRALGFDTMLVEARAPAMVADGRVFALNQQSLAALAVLGVLPRLRSPPHPILSVRLSVAGQFGALRLNAGDRGQELLGAAIPAQDLYEAFATAIASSGVRRLCPFRCVGIERRQSMGVECRLLGEEGERAVLARLVVGADGSESTVRRLVGVGARPCGVPAQVLLAPLASELGYEHCAELRFTAEGPVALVPIGPRRLAGILMFDEAQDVDLAGAERRFQHRLGWRHGRVRVIGAPRIHRLMPQRAERIAGARWLLIGQAALTLHPLAAQGLNLSLRDLAVLVESLAGATDPGDEHILARYARARRSDHDRTLALVEGLRALFAPASSAAALLRQLGLWLCDRFGPLRRAVLRFASGIEPPVPALLRAAWP